MRALVKDIKKWDDIFYSQENLLCREFCTAWIDCVQTIREEIKGDKIELLDYSGTLIFSIPYDAFSTIEII